MLKIKIKKLIENIDKIPQEFWAETDEGKYKVLWILNRQKPSVEVSYDFDEERLGITQDGMVIYGFDSGCSCPIPWSAGDYGDNQYITREYKEFFMGDYKDHDDWFDDGWEEEAQKTLDDLMLFFDKSISVDRLLAIENAEIKRAIMKRVGYEKVRGGAKVIHQDGDMELIEIDKDKYVKVKDSSTDREYLLYVSEMVKTCREAVAWTFYLTEAEYKPIIET